MPQFFIDRPVFAWVIALFILLAGALAIPQLPVAQYPEITPPTVLVTASYPGANAQTVLDTVAAPIECPNSTENPESHFFCAQALATPISASRF